MFTSIILAAGMGTRMKSNMPKVLHKVCGKQLCKWVIDASKEAGADNVVTIIGHKADMVKEALGNVTEFALQNEQKGTGHAVMQAVDFIKATEGRVVILNGDTPLINAETIKKAVEYNAQKGEQATVITAILPDATGYGRIVRDNDGGVLKIVEQKDASEEEKKINEVNSGMYVFDAQSLVYALDKIQPNNAQGEYYLTDTLEILLKAGKKVGAYAIEDNDEIRGINDRVQLNEAENIMRSRINEMHMRNGVTMRIPESIYIEADVEIGSDTEIQPNVTLKSGTKIGCDCVIGQGSVLDNAVIHDNVEILSSVILNSEVDEYTHVGPFAYIRPNCHVGKDVKVGDFVELKNSNIDDGTKISHLTYIGDSDVGKRVNFGCGTVTCNYDGKNKYRTVIGDDCFVGCNTNFVSPINVGDNAYIAAGSTITEDIPEKSLSIARAKQVNKEGWTDKRNK
ncbi:MAG: bifunctional UDP-N-acetylglucosamine diphosphorylase/glucosamine-1-phosphate N-acetyltransferase GlmU [Clostridia bacterium]|nr:bifunctional UDP-N-acetylglucosamine diphosphorylase/glucosamine-1-phosphate N-acetyltransferase GlmU [Clostridia bacterium]